MSLQTLNSVSWQSAYERYRQTPTWLEKRRLVLERAKKICEGCGCRKAREVHHLRYPVNCLAGSAEWIKREKLFDLVALCFGLPLGSPCSELFSRVAGLWLKVFGGCGSLPLRL